MIINKNFFLKYSIIGIFIAYLLLNAQNLLANKMVEKFPKNGIHLSKDTAVRNLDLYLMIGQSNMSGRAIVTAKEKDTLQDVYLFNGSDFERASTPMNKYSTVRKTLSMQALNPSYSFGKELGALSGKKIGLVVNARGGTKIQWWQKGYKGPGDYNLYENAVKQLKKAEKYGTLKAIIWHQGEANSKRPEEYMLLLKKLVNDLRKDVGRNVYFVAGEIGRWKKGASSINMVIDDIPQEIKNTDYVNSKGLSPLRCDITNPHFNTRSQLILGQRYALKILNKIYHISLE